MVIPFGALCAAQLVGRVASPLERTAKVVEVLPRDAQAQHNYAKALHEGGRVAEAIERYKFALIQKPSLAEAELFLGLAWSDVGEMDQGKSITSARFCLSRKTESANRTWRKHPSYAGPAR